MPSGHRPGSDRTPGGSVGGSGSRTGSSTRRAARPAGSHACRSSRGKGVGTTDSSDRVYGCCGLPMTSSVVPDSTMRPRYITTTRSHSAHARPMSCVMKISARPWRLLQLHEHLQHLGTHGYVQRGHGLVAHQALGLEHHRRRDHDALALAPRQLVRVPVPVAFGGLEPGGFQGIDPSLDAVDALLLQAVDRERLLHERTHALPRAQRLVRVLEHHLHAPSQLPHVGVGQR